MTDWNPQQIKKLRDRLWLSQEAVGERIGVTRNYVYYLEKGVRQPSKTLQLLLDYIDMELDGIFARLFDEPKEKELEKKKSIGMVPRANHKSC